MLLDLYDRLHSTFGPQHWWPGETPFEVIVGAILTQSVSWYNVARAISNLKEAGLLDPRGLHNAPSEQVAPLIRPTGYYVQKTKKLRSFLTYLWDVHSGDLDRMFSTEPDALRRELLGIWGLGPETVDSIMLYAGGLPTFVVDAYTVRILGRMGILADKAQYEDVRRLFMDALPANPRLFNEYHALFVNLGKHYCLKTSPRCADCPAASFCRRIGVTPGGNDVSAGVGGDGRAGFETTASRQKAGGRRRRGQVPPRKETQGQEEGAVRRPEGGSGF